MRDRKSVVFVTEWTRAKGQYFAYIKLWQMFIYYLF